MGAVVRLVAQAFVVPTLDKERQGWGTLSLWTPGEIKTAKRGRPARLLDRKNRVRQHQYDGTTCVLVTADHCTTEHLCGTVVGEL
jgi:hypothetical protein